MPQNSGPCGSPFGAVEVNGRFPGTVTPASVMRNGDAIVPSVRSVQSRAKRVPLTKEYGSVECVRRAAADVCESLNHALKVPVLPTACARAWHMASAPARPPMFPVVVVLVVNATLPMMHVPFVAQNAFEAQSASLAQVVGQLVVLPSQRNAPQAAPAGCVVSTGQAAAFPEQFSATSQPPATSLHSVVEPRNASTGHCGPRPSHDSTSSQTPAETRHTVPACTTESAGHSPPSHSSLTSQSPADGRQMVLSGVASHAPNPSHAPVRQLASSQSE